MSTKMEDEPVAVPASIVDDTVSQQVPTTATVSTKIEGGAGSSTVDSSHTATEVRGNGSHNDDDYDDGDGDDAENAQSSSEGDRQDSLELTKGTEGTGTAAVAVADKEKDREGRRKRSSMTDVDNGHKRKKTKPARRDDDNDEEFHLDPVEFQDIELKEGKDSTSHMNSKGQGQGRSVSAKGKKQTEKKSPTKRSKKSLILFQNRLRELKTFKEKFGHCHVGQRNKEYPQLGQFVKKIREYKKKMDDGKYTGQVLTEERIQELTNLGFEWVSAKAKKVKTFEERLQDLEEYKAEHGNCDVPRVYEKDQPLGSWCHCLRISYRQIKEGDTKPMKKLSKEKIQALEEMGFKWTLGRPGKAPREKVGQKSFDERLIELRVFKEKHGHLRVTEKLDKNLAHFCNHIRTAKRYREQKYNVMLITPERIKALDDLGFEWKPSMPRSGAWFDARLDQLKAFKEKHGHLHVTYALDKGLAGFCAKVRSAISNPEKGDGMFVMTEEKIKALNDIGFEWENERSKKTFEERLEQLKAFKEKHNHLRVTNLYDKGLAAFCANARSSKANPSGKGGLVLTDERIEALDDIGFMWVQVDNRGITAFRERVEQLKAFKEEHGHLRVTSTHHKGLAQFCANLRYKKATLTEEKTKILDDLEFDWKPIRKRGGVDFEDRLDQLKAFKEEHGHLKVTKTTNKGLAAFCTKMRSARKNPTKALIEITEEQIEALDDIGFKWNVRTQMVSFEERLEQLKRYKEQYGTVAVSPSCDRSLSVFCYNLRYARKKPGNIKLTEERIKALDEIGFDWNPSSRPVAGQTNGEEEPSVDGGKKVTVVTGPITATATTVYM